MDDAIARDLIEDHSRRPRFFGALPGATGTAEGINPGCGDRVRVHVRLQAAAIADIRFDGEGCSISQASASLMAEAVNGLTVAAAEELHQKFHELLTRPDHLSPPPADTPDPEADDDLGKLMAFAGVKKFPIRVKCATLCWHTLSAALRSEGKTVSTESLTDRVD